MFQRCAAAIVALLGLMAAPVSADVVLYTDEAAFLAAAGGGLFFESFEDIAPGGTGSSRILDHVILGPIDFYEDMLEILDDPAFASDGSQSAGGARSIGFFGFENPLPNAFAFTVADFGNAGDNTLEIRLSEFLDEFAIIPLATDEDPFQAFRFFGLISTRPFTTVDIRHGNAEDFIAVDAVRFGRTVIPEPATCLLLGIGAAGVWLKRGKTAYSTTR